MTTNDLTSCMTELELACGTVYGFDDSLPPLLVGPVEPAPRIALQNAVRPALLRPPCVVSFSGGRDSSAVLAVATEVARTEGLPLPVPVTLRFPGAADSVENQWQDLVVHHLGLPDWQRLEMAEEMDIVGPIARPVLLEHGVQWPFNSYFHVPIFELAAGGSVLTGVGGDELFSAGQWHRENLVLSGRRRPSPLDPVRIALALTPAFVRRRYLARRIGPQRHPRTWLAPEALAASRRAQVESATRESLAFSRSIRRSWWPRRSRLVGQASLDALAAHHDVRCVSPLCAPELLASFIHARGWRAFTNRSQAMADLVGDLLPADLTSRPTKAGFGEVFFTSTARRFAQTWDGTGLNTDVVDTPRLKDLWTDDGDVPDARSFGLLQAAWVAKARGTDSAST